MEDAYSELKERNGIIQSTSTFAMSDVQDIGYLTITTFADDIAI